MSLRSMPPRVADAIRQAAETHAVTVAEIMGRARCRRISAARFAAYRLVHAMTKPDGSPAFSLTQVGRYFGRDHTTILYAISDPPPRRKPVLVAATRRPRPPSANAWTPGQIQALHDHPHLTAKRLAPIVSQAGPPRTPRAVCTKRERLGLRSPGVVGTSRRALMRQAKRAEAIAQAEQVAA